MLRKMKHTFYVQYTFSVGLKDLEVINHKGFYAVTS
jgi:hypothetical protein